MYGHAGPYCGVSHGKEYRETWTISVGKHALLTSRSQDELIPQVSLHLPLDRMVHTSDLDG